MKNLKKIKPPLNLDQMSDKKSRRSIWSKQINLIFLLLISLTTSKNLFSNKYVITGGPCSGKTTLIDNLTKEGFQIVPEIPRLVIQRTLDKGKPHPFGPQGNPEKTEERFIKKQVEFEINTEKAYSSETIFCDRGLFDILAYCKYYKLKRPKNFNKNKAKHNPYTKIFFLELPKEALYIQDEVRIEPYSQALILDNLIKKTYEEFGYELTIIPFTDTPEERIKIILNLIKQN
jgi:predicted ATPase